VGRGFMGDSEGLGGLAGVCGGQGGPQEEIPTGAVPGSSGKGGGGEKPGFISELPGSLAARPARSTPAPSVGTSRWCQVGPVPG